MTQSNDMSSVGVLILVWVGAITSTQIPIVLSSIASLLAMASYGLKLYNDWKNLKK